MGPHLLIQAPVSWASRASAPDSTPCTFVVAARTVVSWKTGTCWMIRCCASAAAASWPLAPGVHPAAVSSFPASAGLYVKSLLRLV
jgi:hypothetical protein